MVGVHSQTVPYLTFMEEILPNNSYVDLSLVGEGETDVIICHTDCCNNSNITGEWFFPNETSLPDADIGNASTNPISQKWLHQGIQLQRGPNTSNISTIPSGIYRCDIAVSQTKNKTLYVGIYGSGGALVRIPPSNYINFIYLYSYKYFVVYLTIFNNCNFFIVGNLAISDFSIADSVLTCISTGGPVTTITWTRNSVIIPDNANYTQVTVLDDSITGRYIHTLSTATMFVAGVYECAVSNNKSSAVDEEIKGR